MKHMLARDCASDLFRKLLVFVVLCSKVGDHAPRHPDRHPGRADHKQLSVSQSKRPRPASAALSHTLWV